MDPNSIFTELPSGTDLKGFSQPIFSLGGMKETTRLGNPTINDCIASTHQYTLMSPHLYDYGYLHPQGDSEILEICKVAYPDEWNKRE